MKYILDSATITSFGEYCYSPIPLKEMKDWIDAGDWESNIADPDTCKLLARLIGVDIPTSSKEIKMRPGDEALVLSAAFLSEMGSYDTKEQGTDEAVPKITEVRDDVDVRLWDYHLYSTGAIGLLRRIA